MGFRNCEDWLLYGLEGIETGVNLWLESIKIKKFQVGWVGGWGESFS